MGSDGIRMPSRFEEGTGDVLEQQEKTKRLNGQWQIE
jgi:hypothetical protein